MYFWFHEEIINKEILTSGGRDREKSELNVDCFAKALNTKKVAVQGLITSQWFELG